MRSKQQAAVFTLHVQGKLLSLVTESGNPRAIEYEQAERNSNQSMSVVAANIEAATVDSL
eukprot:2877-Heterococcus_DN1.PRE.2